MSGKKDSMASKVELQQQGEGAQGSLWEGGGSAEFHAKLRFMTDKTDVAEIKEALVKYTETVAQVEARFPAITGNDRISWAIAMALSPEWYGEGLNNRIQNSMLVSALLLTVTASIFVYPPSQPESFAAYRCVGYFSFLCNVLFIASIMTGIFFIEAISRAYGQSERFALIIKFYWIKDVSQITMAVGAALFPVILAISSWPQFLAGDSAIFILGTILLVLFASYVMIATQQAGSVEQATRIKKFSVMVCAESSYLLPQYYPEADMQPEEYRQMYKQ